MNTINLIFLLLGKLRKAKGYSHLYFGFVLYVGKRPSHSVPTMSPLFSAGYYKIVLENISKNLDSVLIFTFFSSTPASFYMQLRLPLE